MAILIGTTLRMLRTTTFLARRLSHTLAIRTLDVVRAAGAGGKFVVTFSKVTVRIRPCTVRVGRTLRSERCCADSGKFPGRAPTGGKGNVTNRGERGRRHPVHYFRRVSARGVTGTKTDDVTICCVD